MKSNLLPFSQKHFIFPGLIIAFLLGFYNLVWGQQDSIYFQDFGTGTLFPSGWHTSGGDNNWTISTDSSSTTPTFSGGSNLLSGSSDDPRTVIFSDTLSTEGYSNITILWGARRAYTDTVTCEWSSDGNTWNTINFTEVPDDATWKWINGGTRIGLPSNASGVSDLSFRWTYDSDDSAGAYRIDDFSVEGCLLPYAAGTISGQSPVCQGDSDLEYTVPEISNADSYIWDYDGDGATIVGTSETVTVSFSNLATSGDLTVKGHNDCGDGDPSSISITVNPLPDPAGTITGHSPVCQGDSDLEYTVPEISNADSYIWDYDGDGATIVGTSETVTISFSNSATSGDLTVKGHNECGSGTSSFFSIEVYDELEAGDITGGSTPLCYGDDGGTLTANPQGGSGNYTITWYNDENDSVGSGDDYAVGNLYETIGFYYKVDDEVCGIKESSTFNIVIIDLVTASVTIVTSNNPVCMGEEAGFTATAINGGASPTYQWKLNDQNVGGNIFTYSSNTMDDGDEIYCILTSSLSCAINNPDSSNVIIMNVLESPDPDFIKPIPKPKPENGIPIILICADSGHIYQWYKNDEIIQGATGQFYYPGLNSIIEPGAEYQINVEYINGCEKKSEPFSYMGNKSMWFSTGNVAVFPNPNNGHFYLIINDEAVSGSTDSFTMKIIDLNGKEILQKEIFGLYHKINLEFAKKGMYFLELTNSGQKQLRKIIIY